MTNNQELTNEQKAILKDAIYKISDAYELLKGLADEMKKNKQWYYLGDINRMVSEIDENLTGKEGSMHFFLEAL